MLPAKVLESFNHNFLSVFSNICFSKFIVSIDNPHALIESVTAYKSGIHFFAILIDFYLHDSYHI